MVKALILIDFEEEWRNKKSDYYLGEFKNKIENAKRLLKTCRENGITIIFTRHIEPDPTPAFAKGTKNIEIINELKPLPNEKIVEKNKISPFYKTDLEKYLKKNKIDELIVGGIMTNLCVRSTISEAYDRDFKLILSKDTCVSDSVSTDKNTIKDLKNTRPEVEVLSTSEIIKKITKSK